MEEKFKKLMELMLLGEIDGDELVRSYKEYSEIKIPEWKKPVKVSVWRRYHYAFAAAIALLLVAGGILLYHKLTPVKPVISEDVRLAMEQSGKSGKMEAEVKSLVPAAVENAVKRTQSARKEDFSSARQVTTEPDKEFWVTLDDGTVVHLNSDTYLIYPDKPDAHLREVILDGEAYFMVANDASRQFVVHTGQGDIRVYGTEFNVSTREKTGATEVVLIEGSVSVMPAGGLERHIAPGQKATIGTGVTVEEIDVEQYVAWNTGKFAFRDWPLSRVMEVISRWYGCTVSFDEPSLGAQRLYGYFDRYDNLSATIESLSMVTGLDFDVKEETIFIHKHQPN